MDDMGKIFCISPLFIALSRMLEEGLIRISEKAQEKKCCRKTVWSTRRVFILAWMLIMVCWIPVWLAAFPGIYAYDAVTQTAEFYLNTGLSGHHPIAHTAFLWGSFSLGKMLFGTYEAGMAVYAFVQMVVLSLIYAYAICKIKEWGVPKAFTVFFFLCLCLFQFTVF